MDTATLVGEQIEDGRLLIAELRRQSFDVVAACWAKASEDQFWRMYVATSIVDNEGSTAAYRQFYGAIKSIPHSWIFTFDVKLIAKSSPIALDILKIQHRSPSSLPIRFDDQRLGNLFIEEAYIYPAG